jgi:hypothetical protein
VEQIDIQDLIEDLKVRVADRRQSGDYPVGLEEQLEAQFKVIMAAVHRDEVDTKELGLRVHQVEVSSDAVSAFGQLTSRLPGGSSVHSAAARVVGRHTGQLAVSVRQLGVDIAGALHEIHHLIDVQREADERQLHEVVASLLDRVSIVDHLADVVVQIEARLAELESAVLRPS